MTSQDDTANENTANENTAKENICLFGGTFDPIHLGHTHIATEAVRKLNLDRVLFLPCRQSPHKAGQEHASEQHRLAMCRLSTENFEWAEVNDHDLTAPAPSYSWITAEAMAARFANGRLFWLMGTDQWEALPRWNRPEHLSSLVEFIVFTRGAEPVPRAGYRLHSIIGDHPASATAIRKSAPNQLKTDWLDPKVGEYIRKHSLYLPQPTNKQGSPSAQA